MMNYRTWPSWSYYHKAFTDEEVNFIHSFASQIDQESAKVYTVGGFSESPHYRKTNLKWIKADNKTGWIFDRIKNITLDLNDRFYGMEFKYMEDLQYTMYDEIGSYYDWHVDMAYGEETNEQRKMSVVVLLSDLKDFQGGDLLVKSSIEETKIEMEKGTLIIFPSFLMHKVTPITMGKRVSLVTWFNGNKFK